VSSKKIVNAVIELSSKFVSDEALLVFISRLRWRDGLHARLHSLERLGHREAYRFLKDPPVVADNLGELRLVVELPRATAGDAIIFLILLEVVLILSSQQW
jgi:hypothetical protein